MSKNKTPKQPKAPSYQNSAIYNGDQMVSQNYLDPATNQVITKYNSSPAEQQAKTQAQAGINSILPQLGQTTAQQQQGYDDAGNAYQAKLTQDFNNSYDPTLRNLREDTGSRFGTLKATPYFDKLTNLEQAVHAPALVDIAASTADKKQQLYQNDQNNLINRLQALGYVVNGQNANTLANLSNTQQSSSSGNNFNLSNYQAQLAAQNQQFQQQQIANSNSFLSQYLRATGQGGQQVLGAAASGGI